METEFDPLGTVDATGEYIPAKDDVLAPPPFEREGLSAEEAKDKKKTLPPVGDLTKRLSQIEQRNNPSN